MDETTEINMLYGEFKAFKNEWLKKWRPAIGEGCTGVMTTLFEDLDKFVLTTDYEGPSINCYTYMHSYIQCKEKNYN